MIAVSRTDVGKLRANNQDALVAMEQLWGVADGMGGHKGGEIASAGARDGLTRILRGKDPDPKMLRFAVEAVNRRLYLQQKDDASHRSATAAPTSSVTAIFSRSHRIIRWCRSWSIRAC